MVTIALDATPLRKPRSGVGRYVHELTQHISASEDAPGQVWLALSRQARFPVALPPGARVAPRNLPARLLLPMWSLTGRPTVDRLTGPVGLFHGTNYILAPTRAGVPRVLTVHDLTFRRFPETVAPQMRQVLARVPAAARAADAVIAVSHAMAEEIAAELRVPAERIVVAPNGVDDDWFDAARADDARRDLGLPQRYFVAVGTLEPRKNLRMLARAHAQASRADPGLPPLLIAGAHGWGEVWSGGPPDPDRVRLLGRLPDARLQAVVAGAVASCSASRYEGFGLPVLEAMATGTPVLASDIAAHREVVGDLAEADSGVLLLPPDDEQAWADALVRAASMRRPLLPSQLRQRARQFSWAGSARVHLRTYRDLMS